MYQRIKCDFKRMFLLSCNANVVNKKIEKYTWQTHKNKMQTSENQLGSYIHFMYPNGLNKLVCDPYFLDTIQHNVGNTTELIKRKILFQ